MTSALSVVIPAYNEAEHLARTLDALSAAAEASTFDVDVVLVDDGSGDASAEVARRVLHGRLPLRVIQQPNRGRFEARRAGLEAATGDWVLLLDGRVRLHRRSLQFVSERVHQGESVWNGHVHVETAGNPYGAFWNVLAELAWREYFDDVRTTSFDAERFDRYPKGTGCFLAPRELMLAAVAAFRSAYADVRHANDDTPVLRWIAARHRIHLSPSFACDYAPRTTLSSFLRHSLHRGVVFVDGHGRRESRFFPAVALFFPASVVLGVAAARRPLAVPALTAAGVAAAAAAVATAAGRSAAEVAAFAGLAPVYALAHGAGMWRGLGMLLVDRLHPALRT